MTLRGRLSSKRPPRSRHADLLENKLILFPRLLDAPNDGCVYSESTRVAYKRRVVL